ncbi:cytochrome P450 3A8-like [Nematostella vectensis]|uniref:cytochrome P450 3A8-like n=1 Tax=Nematostella vectensis TaxID=45351 RepID=UPI0020774435|nr:cytochrome P450 3A8-like [Nematostella vectensis]
MLDDSISPWDALPHPAFIALSLALLAIGVYVYGTYPFWVLRRLNIPGAPPRPFSGNLGDIQKYGGQHMALLEYRKRYGKVFSFCTGKNVEVIVADPDMLKQILVKEFSSFRNRHFAFPPKGLIRLGLFASKDEDWKRVRSTLTPTFTSGKMKTMIPLVSKSCDTLIQKLGEVADTEHSINMLSWYSQMTLEIILSCAFGVDSNVQTNQENEFLQKARSIFHPPAFLKWLLALPFTQFLRYFAGLFRTQIDFFMDLARGIIQARLAHQGKGRKDLVELMLNAHNEENGGKLTADEVIAQSATFLLAGHETAGNALTFTTYHLVVNPEIQERLREEILAAMRREPDKPLYELIFGLEYLEAVVNESLRITPPAHVMTRECTKECTINGITIPAGMIVKYPIYTLHHDPEAWEEPEKFNPERFLTRDDSRSPFQFLPFGAGPRICIGARFAMMEVKAALVKILSKYRLVRAPDTQVPLKVVSGFTLTCKDGLHVRVQSL